MSALLRNTAALVDDHPPVAYPQTNILAPFQRLHIIALAFWVFRVGLDLALYALRLWPWHSLQYLQRAFPVSALLLAINIDCLKNRVVNLVMTWINGT